VSGPGLRSRAPRLYAFDLLELDGEDLRPLPLAERKAKLARLLTRKPLGIVFNEHTDEDGATVFRHACSAFEPSAAMCVPWYCRRAWATS
jgi:ATP-dependent DNA ligase